MWFTKYTQETPKIKEQNVQKSIFIANASIFQHCVTPKIIHDE